MPYFYVESQSEPVLVKWSEDVSYLPIFENESAASAWGATLKVQIRVMPFSFAVAHAAVEGMKKAGHMVFVLPADPRGEREYA